MAYTSVNLASLPKPDLIQSLDYEAVLAAMKAAVIEAMPDLEDVLALESEPATAVLQVCAYFVLLNRAAINDSARAVMLAYATGADLDNLAAVFGVERKVIEEGDPEAVPPVPDTMEPDDEFRARAQLAPELLTTAGPRAAYRAHALNAHEDVFDASADSPTPGIVRVVILGRAGNEAVGTTVVDAVQDYLSADEIRPLCDTVVVEEAAITTYAIAAALTLTDDADETAVYAAAQASATAYAETRRRLNKSVPKTGIIAALHVDGVDSVSLTSPAADVAADPVGVNVCSGITLT